MSQAWIELELCFDSDARLPASERERIAIQETGIRSLTPYHDLVMGTGTILVLDTVSKNRASRVIRVRDRYEDVRSKLTDPSMWHQVSVLSDSIASIPSRDSVTLVRLAGIKALRDTSDSLSGALCQLTLDGYTTDGASRTLLITQSYSELKTALAI